MESEAAHSLDQGEAETLAQETSPEVLTIVYFLDTRPKTSRNAWWKTKQLLLLFFPRCCSGRSVRVTSLCADTAATAVRIKAVGSAAGSNNADRLHVFPPRRTGWDVNLFNLLDWTYFCFCSFYPSEAKKDRIGPRSNAMRFWFWEFHPEATFPKKKVASLFF